MTNVIVLYIFYTYNKNTPLSYLKGQHVHDINGNMPKHIDENNKSLYHGKLTAIDVKYTKVNSGQGDLQIGLIFKIEKKNSKIYAYLYMLLKIVWCFLTFIISLNSIKF